MRRPAIGIMAGLGALLGSALAAEAQGITITGTGPLAVYHNDNQSTYTATVTWTGNFNFRLWVYLNGVQKHDSGTVLMSSPGPSVNISRLVTGMNAWGMHAGDQLKYRGKVWTSPSNQKTHDWIITVQQGTTQLLPDRNRLPLRGQDREELLAVVDRREEREWA